MPLADRSVHTICTSPPYFGLRSYAGLTPTCWPGGSYAPVPGAPPITVPGPSPEEMAACAHMWSLPHAGNPRGGSGTYNGRNNNGEGYARGDTRGESCLTCGCWRGHLGAERTPIEFVWHMILVLREVKRVLRDDGVVWWNLGDSHSASGKSGGSGQGERWQVYGQDHVGPRGGKWHTTQGYPNGSLLGIPQQVMLAAIADGWIVRNDVIYAKAACMPESIRGWRWQHKRCRCVSHARGAEPYRN